MRCLIDVPGEKLPASLAEHLAGHVAPQVPEGLRAAFLEAVAGGRICSMQNKLMPAAPLHRPGALLLGDAFNMRHPLTGVLLHRLDLADCESAAMRGAALKSTHLLRESRGQNGDQRLLSHVAPIA